MLIAALLVIAPKWKQAEYPLVGEWVNKPLYTYTTENYPAIKNGMSYWYTQQHE